MPEICRFFGIVISMVYAERQPSSFHARYGSHRATIRIGDLSVLDGHLPPRALGLVVEWAALHRGALLADWDLARRGRPLRTIAPLE